MSETKKSRVPTSTCGFWEADIAIFPIFRYSVVEMRKVTSKVFVPPGEKVIGVADLLPLVPNRLSLFETTGRTFHRKNQVLEFSIVEKDEEPSQYWNQLLHHVQHTHFPHVWVIAPEQMCEDIMVKEVRNDGMVYYHNPLLQMEKNYFLITKVNGKFKTRPIGMVKTRNCN